MEITLALAPLLQYLPSSISIILGLVSVSLLLFFHFKKTNVEEKTATSEIQKNQVESLLAQIELLSKELTTTRNQITELHNQNIKLMEELRLANHKIGELEKLLETK